MIVTARKLLRNLRKSHGYHKRELAMIDEKLDQAQNHIEEQEETIVRLRAERDKLKGGK